MRKRRCATRHLHWRNLAESGVENMLDAIISQITTAAIWFSIDKDMLPESEALTNWGQGQLPLAAVTQIIAALGARKRIAGAGICGEYSPA